MKVIKRVVHGGKSFKILEDEANYFFEVFAQGKVLVELKFSKNTSAYEDMEDLLKVHLSDQVNVVVLEVQQGLAGTSYRFKANDMVRGVTLLGEDVEGHWGQFKEFIKLTFSGLQITLDEKGWSDE